ncbi:hypothetical protein ACHQM5_005671 [Ranunculus cassubicifolius]
MEMSAWLAEMGLEDDSAFINQYQMNCPDDFTQEQLSAAFAQETESFSYCPNIDLSPWALEATQTCCEKPIKKLKTTTDGWDSCTTEAAFTPDGSSPAMLSFGTSSSSPSMSSQGTRQSSYEISSGGAKESNISSAKNNAYLNQNYASKSGKGNRRARAPSTKPPSTVQDHVVAERKRREKLSLQFIALSAIVPGLKKMDKSTVLGDAIQYLKEIQERVKTLEEQKAKMTMKSVVLIKEFQSPSDDVSSSTDDLPSDFSDEPLPEIRAKVLDKNVLIRIHCKQQRGVMAKVLSEIEKVGVIVQDSSMMASGSTLDITIVAQMDKDLDINVGDLMNKLHSAFRRFM